MYLTTLKEEVDFIDFLFDLMHNEPADRSQLAKQIYCRFTGQTVQEFDDRKEDFKKINKLLEDVGFGNHKEE